MRRAACLLSGLCAACVAPEAQLWPHAWEPRGYQGFSESIDAFAGPLAIDCGFFDMTEGKTIGMGQRRQALACIAEATDRGLAFKFGTLRMPIDSYAHEIFVRTTKGQSWMIVYDVMIDGDAPQQWNRLCASVQVDPRTLLLHGEGCVEKSTGRLNAS